MSILGENQLVNECLQSAISLVDIALTVHYKYFFVSGMSDERFSKCSIQSNALILFALAASYCISSAVKQKTDNGCEIIKSAMIKFCEFAKNKACEMYAAGKGPILPPLNTGMLDQDLLSSAAAFVDKFCPSIPEQPNSAQSISKRLFKIQVQIFHPPESNDHSIALEFDCRLPYRMLLDLELTNTTLPLPRYLQNNGTWSGSLIDLFECCRLCICISCPDGSCHFVPFNIKEVVILESLDLENAQPKDCNAEQTLHENSHSQGVSGQCVINGSDKNHRNHGVSVACKAIASGLLFVNLQRFNLRLT